MAGIISGGRPRPPLANNCHGFFVASGDDAGASGSFSDDLKFRIPSPSPLPSSDNLPGPKINNAIARTTNISGSPSLNGMTSPYCPRHRRTPSHSAEKRAGLQLGIAFSLGHSPPRVKAAKWYP